MNSPRHDLAREYAATLRECSEGGGEAVLERAYRLGRLAVANRVGLLDLARVHAEALEHWLQPGSGVRRAGRVLKAAEDVFREALSPFEVTHRGFRETSLRLRQLIATLKRRNLALGKINHRLRMEIKVRKRAERSLRRSEDHLRRLFNDARIMQERLRTLSRQILSAQEEERKRVSRELHDEVGQALTTVSVSLEVLKRNGAAAGKRSERAVLDIQLLLRQATETVHRFARELRPAMLDELGLLPALRSHIAAFSGRTGLSVRLRGSPAAERLNSDQKTVLFRVAQEGLTNVAKHAQARRVEVTLRKVRNGISLVIADDGKSFAEGAVTRAKDRNRLGLVGMQERVSLVNGRFSIKPQLGRGTTIRAVVPLARPGRSVAANRTRG